jgi:hypothetical protein
MDFEAKNVSREIILRFKIFSAINGIGQGF